MDKMNRRDFVKAGLATALAFGLEPNAGQARHATRPNILLIMTDQQFADAISCAMGPEYIKTPNIDRIAAAGMRFTRAYCSNPLCVPSRSSIFTGRYPHEHGKQINATKPRLDPKEFPNMGMVLRDAGYVTGYVGKWHLPYPGGGPGQSGFDFVSHLSGAGNDPKIAVPAIEFIKHNKDRRFLLVCSFMNPHNICQYGRGQPLPDGDVGQPRTIADCPPAPENLEKARNQSDALEAVWHARLRARRGNGRMFAPLDKWDADDWRRYRWAYYRMVELVDKHLGKILAALENEGLVDKTLIIFTSDHGDGLGAHRWAQKNMFYDETARIPLIISQRGVTVTGTSDYLVNNGIDLMPTVCDYAGAALPAGCKGTSLRAIAEGTGTGRKRRYVACSTHFVQDRRADGRPIDLRGRMIRTERFKYYIFDQGKQPEMLIDMENDPAEMVNLVGNPAFKNTLEGHRAYMQEYGRATGDSLAVALAEARMRAGGP